MNEKHEYSKILACVKSIIKILRFYSKQTIDGLSYHFLNIKFSYFSIHECILSCLTREIHVCTCICIIIKNIFNLPHAWYIELKIKNTRLTTEHWSLIIKINLFSVLEQYMVTEHVQCIQLQEDFRINVHACNQLLWIIN